MHRVSQDTTFATQQAQRDSAIYQGPYYTLADNPHAFACAGMKSIMPGNNSRMPQPSAPPVTHLPQPSAPPTSHMPPAPQSHPFHQAPAAAYAPPVFQPPAPPATSAAHVHPSPLAPPAAYMPQPSPS